MKATPILYLLLTVFISGISGVKAQQNNLPEEQLRLRQEVRPYLNSLIIEEPKPNDKDISLFRLESVFPVNKLTSNDADPNLTLPGKPVNRIPVKQPEYDRIHQTECLRKESRQLLQQRNITPSVFLFLLVAIGVPYTSDPCSHQGCFSDNLPDKHGKHRDWFDGARSL